MGYALIWVEGLGVALLVVATVTAWTARWSGRFRRVVVPLLVQLLILALGAAVALGAAELRFRYGGVVAHDWFLYTLSWAVIFLVASSVVIRRGLKRSGDPPLPAARSWASGRLQLWLGGLAILLAITVFNLDHTALLEITQVREEAGNTLLAMAPQPVPEKDNAAPIYQEAFAALTPLERLRQDWVKGTSARILTELQLDHADVQDQGPLLRSKELNDYLDSQERALTLLRRAAAKRGCQFPEANPARLLDVEARFFPQGFDFVFASRLLALDARSRAARGDARTAVDDIAAILGMARQIPEPVSVEVEARGLVALQEVFWYSSPRPEDLARLRLDREPPYERHFLRIQADYALLTLANLAPEHSAYWYWDWSKEILFRHRLGQPLPDGFEAPAWFDATVMPTWRVFLAPDDLNFVRRALQRWQNSAEAPPGPSDIRWRDLLEALDVEEGGCMYAKWMQPRIRSVAAAICNVATRRRLLRLAVAALAYKTRHGRYPNDVANLVPAFLDSIPLDPWDGRPLHLGPPKGKRGEVWLILKTDRGRGKQETRSKLYRHVLEWHGQVPVTDLEIGLRE
jgi:hypothetical protein